MVGTFPFYQPVTLMYRFISKKKNVIKLNVVSINDVHINIQFQHLTCINRFIKTTLLEG